VQKVLLKSPLGIAACSKYSCEMSIERQKYPPMVLATLDSARSVRLPKDFTMAKAQPLPLALDRIDVGILRALQRDARMSLADISAQVALTPSPCWSRIRRLEEAGVIEGYSVRLSAEKIGLKDTVIVQVTLDSHSDEALERFGRRLEEIPEVLEAFLVSGDYDYYLRIAVADTRDYERLLREKLYKIPGIRHSKSSFVLRQLKRGELPLGQGSASAGAASTVARKAARPARHRAKAR
jgi:Lrp/AsnC family transcriptional regulator, leucine-responsive regulatory protein